MKFIATRGADKIEIEITEEALIKLSTDAVSQAEHANVESIYKLVASMAGGTTKRTLKPNLSLAQALQVHAHDGHTHSH